MYRFPHDLELKIERGGPERSAKLPEKWKDHVHVHVWQANKKGRDGCGGCRVLWELADSVSEIGISVSSIINRCPNVRDLAEPLAVNKTIAIVYPEIIGKRCLFDKLYRVVHVRWILAPLARSHEFRFRSWASDDFVFNYASSCAVYPNHLPSTNILQVMSHPKDGDSFDLSPEPLNQTDRIGTAWTVRKGKSWHDMNKVGRFHELFPGPHVQVNNPDPSLLRPYKYFVSYDPYTFYSYAAAMSGTISIVVPLLNMSKEVWVLGTYVGEYIRRNGGDIPGIAYGIAEEEIRHATETKAALRGFLMDVRWWGKSETVERFARDCYRKGAGWSEWESALLVEDAYTCFYNENNTLKEISGKKYRAGLAPGTTR